MLARHAHRSSRPDGVALVLVVTILAVLALLAVALARLSRIELEASLVHQEETRADLAAQAGFEYALARIQAAEKSGDFDGLFEPYGLDPKGPYKPIDLFGQKVTAILDYPSEEALAAAGIDRKTALVLGKPNGRYFETFAVTIRDPQGLINLNAGEDGTARLLDNLGRAIDETDPPIRPGDGKLIVSYRNQLPGKKFQKIEDLLDLPGGLITKDEYLRIAPYITIDSWIDTKVIRPPDAASRPAPGTYYERRWNPGHMELEPRAPININTAPKPVLVAALLGVTSSSERWEGGYELEDYKGWTQESSGPLAIDTGRYLASEIVRFRRPSPALTDGPFAGTIRSITRLKQLLDAHTGLDLPMNSCSISAAIGVGLESQLLVLESIEYEYGGTVYTRYTAVNPATQYVPPVHDWTPGAFDHETQGEFVGLGAHGTSWKAAGGCDWPHGSRYWPVDWSGSFSIVSPSGFYEVTPAEGADIHHGFIEVLADGQQQGKPEGVGISRGTIRFTPSYPGSMPVLSRRQSAAILANGDPNTRLCNFNPDAEHRTLVGKSDLVGRTTEFCLNPGGTYDIAIRSSVVAVGTRGVNASRALRATLRVGGAWRETTQADFARGTISPQRGWIEPSLATYPQPKIARLPELCVEDGEVRLSTCVAGPDSPGRTFWLSFRNSFDATSAAGDPIHLVKRGGRLPAGDVFGGLRPGRIYPDGGCVTPSMAPSYKAYRNMGGRLGTIAYWQKRESDRLDVWNMIADFSCILNSPPPSNQSLAVYIAGNQEMVIMWVGSGDGSAYGFTDAYQRGAFGDRGTWSLVACAYDSDLTRYRPANLCVNGRRGRLWDFAQWETTSQPPCDLWDSDARFYLGPEATGMTGEWSPEVTYGEFSVYSDFDAAGIADRLWRIGRYYNGGDGTFASQICPSEIAVPGKSRVSRVAWTARVPEDIPGGKIRLEILVGDKSSGKLDDPGGSPVDMVVDGPVRYRAYFEETAREGVEPLITSMALDDVTVFFTHAPEITRWETDLPSGLIELLLEPDPELERPEPGIPIPPGGHMEGDEVVFPVTGGGGPPPDWEDLPTILSSYEFDPAGGPMGDPWIASRFRRPGGPTGGGGPGIRGRPGSSRGKKGDRIKVPPVPLPEVRLVIEVTDAETKKPIQEAKVTISSGGTVLVADGLTGRNGRLYYPAERGKTYEVHVEAEGYESATESVPIPGDAPEGDRVVPIGLSPPEGS
ncbi:MAG: hypothetical protein HY720_20630 [Planctomycetes bacterium]|nr:hypothetical protein [Planctomycetota bacterium]